MARYQVILAYDGTEFSGFQRQAKGKQSRTVQAAVESALRQIGWQGSTILAAGRTDAGVHASGQVIAFDLDWGHSEQDLLAAINTNLPFDLAARKVLLTWSDFHPRFDAISRRYRYRIFCQPERDPLRERYAWRVWPAPDSHILLDTAALLLGEHDFSAFGNPLHPNATTVREVFAATWLEQEDDLSFEIAANAFLFRMVRRLVSFQVAIGQGRHEIESLKLLLQAGAKKVVQGIAPACGLTLVEVVYDTPVLKDEAGSRLSSNKRRWLRPRQ